MLPSIPSQDREIFSMIVELVKALRCCRQDEVFCAGEVTFSQFVILDAVAGRGTLDMAELHKLLSVDKSTTTRLIAPLIGRGLLVRKRASLDSRAAMLTLTGDGKAVHRNALQSLKSLIGIIRDEIPAEKRDVCLEGSRLFLQALQRCFDGRPKGRKGLSCCKPS
jgi:DNA-binding MarR family transcriptional regulator